MVKNQKRKKTVLICSCGKKVEVPEKLIGSYKFEEGKTEFVCTECIDKLLRVKKNGFNN